MLEEFFQFDAQLLEMDKKALADCQTKFAQLE